MQTSQLNIRVQKWITLVAVVLFLVKIAAFFLTHSVAVLTDALESIVNIVAALIGLYSLNLSAKPRDLDHPYGHGKVEYISAAVEGALISAAGFTIIYTAVKRLLIPGNLHQVDFGIMLIAGTAIINYFFGVWCKRTGIRNNSLALQSSGSHLISDTITTVGVVIGLLLFKLTGLYWIDSVVAIVVACIIIYTGFSIIRSSVENIMDKADRSLLKKVIETIQENRNENWIDLHNLRILKYGNILHVDCHLTVPWYFNVHEAHAEIDKLGKLVQYRYGESIELFVHTDGCLDFSCSICTKQNCTERKQALQKIIHWNVDNTISNKKHQASLSNS
jgi:cation diffusion facilitator family transporter